MSPGFIKPSPHGNHKNVKCFGEFLTDFSSCTVTKFFART